MSIDNQLSRRALAYYADTSPGSAFYAYEQRRYETMIAPAHNRPEHLAQLAMEYGGEPGDYAMPAYYHEQLARA